MPKRQGNTIKSAELSGGKNFLKRFAMRICGTLRTPDFILMRLVTDWTDRCSGEGKVYVRSKLFLYKPVQYILHAVIFVVADFDPKRLREGIQMGLQGIPAAVVTAFLTSHEDSPE